MSEERQKGGLSEFPRSTEGDLEDKLKGNASSRARNRTVMLTPDVTGHVRSLLSGEHSDRLLSDPFSHLLPAPRDPAAKPVDFGQDLPTESEVTPREAQNSATASSATERSAARTMFLDKGNLPPTFTPIPPGVSVTTPSGRQIIEEPRRQAAPLAAPRVQPQPQTPIVGFLISFDKEEIGEVFEVRAGRWLLTSRPTDHGDYILIKDETISPLHAILRATREGKLQILDQLSEFGTGYTPQSHGDEREISGTMVVVAHGDSLRFGKRHFVVCLVPRNGGAEPPKTE